MSEGFVRPINLYDGGAMLQLLALQLAAYMKEAEMIGLTDIPPLFESPDAVRGSGELFYGYYAEGKEGLGQQLLCGAISVLEGRDELAIRRLMVRPDRFRQGIGSELLRFTLNRSAGRRVTVRTVTANTAARALYSGLGFKPSWEEPTVLDLTLMELTYDPSHGTPKVTP